MTSKEITKEAVIEELKKIHDPELNIDVWTLGLVYEITIDGEGVKLLMTLTTPFCPFADQLVSDIEQQINTLFAGDASKSVRVDLTFEPPWSPSPELRAMLGV